MGGRGRERGSSQWREGEGVKSMGVREGVGE